MDDVTISEARRSLGALLRRPYEALAREVYGALAAQGFPDVRIAHSGVLRHIRPSGSRVTELAERAGMTKQSMAYLVDALAGLGYVESVPDPRDGRAKLVRLTARGHALWETLIALSAAAEARFAARIGPARLASLRGLLEELAGAIEPKNG